MVCVHNPHDGGRPDGRQRDRTDATQPETIGTVEHCSCGLAGLFATVALAVVLYPVLLAVTRPLHVLSSTMLLFILAGVWLVTWLSLELVWEWRAGRLADGRPGRES